MRSVLFLTMAVAVAVIGCQETEPAPPETKIQAPFVQVETNATPRIEKRGGDTVLVAKLYVENAPPKTIVMPQVETKETASPCPLQKRRLDSTTTCPLKRTEKSVLKTCKTYKTCTSPRQFQKTCRQKCNSRTRSFFGKRCFGSFRF